MSTKRILYMDALSVVYSMSNLYRSFYGRSCDFDGKDSQFVQKARLCVSVVRDLRRAGRRMGLRSLRHRAEKKYTKCMVERNDPAARQYCRAGRGNPYASARMGSFRPRGELFRSAGRLQKMQNALPRRYDGSKSARRKKMSRLRRRINRAARIQPDV